LTTEQKYATEWREAAPLPSSPREKTRALARSLALSTLSSFRPARQELFLNCLYCHYVFDDQRERFEELITDLKHLGSFVDTATCIDMLEGRADIDGRYFHLSFDDGFRNVHTNALPILAEHSVPAIVFVPTGLVGADWHQTRRYCLETAMYRGVIEMATWKDLKEAQAHGFEVGSHTRSHKRFTDMSDMPNVLRDEIAGSKRDIEEHLQTECKYISWPYGTLKDADETSLNAAREAGYRAVFGAYRGAVIPGRTGIYSIPRHHFEVQWPLSHVRYFANGGRNR
jgi:peptidoglycan/xylan/chitin deacetylase (PgdA/CDA1 family)